MEQEPLQQDKADKEIDKIGLLALRIEQYAKQVEYLIVQYEKRHNEWINKINATRFVDDDVDPVLLGPMILGKIEIWYSYARAEAYSISGKCRDLQKFYEGVAEQGQANQYERVKLGKEGSKFSNSTDAQYLSRRVKGRLLERAAQWEGKYKQWEGIANSYESTINGVKDLYKLAEYEYMKGGVTK